MVGMRISFADVADDVRFQISWLVLPELSFGG